MEFTKENIPAIAEKTEQKMLELSKELGTGEIDYAAKGSAIKEVLYNAFEDDDTLEAALIQAQGRVNEYSKVLTENKMMILDLNLDGLDHEGMDIMDIKDFLPRAYDLAAKYTKGNSRVTLENNFASIAVLMMMATEYEGTHLTIPAKIVNLMSRRKMFYDLSDVEKTKEPLIH